jgi:uncharacterized membrane protein YjjB (DUF3815 family)
MLEFIYAFFATVGFAIIFRAPFRAIVPAGLIGGVGWIIYVQFEQSGMELAVAAFFSALAIGVLGEIFAKQFKMPATTFVVPGIVTIVPGYPIYQSVLYLIQRETAAASAESANVAMIGVGIAVGILMASSFSRVILRRFRDTNGGYGA